MPTSSVTSSLPPLTLTMAVPRSPQSSVTPKVKKSSGQVTSPDEGSVTQLAAVAV